MKKITAFFCHVVVMLIIALALTPEHALAERTITGTIIYGGGRTASGILIKAYDSDRGEDELMGQAITDSQGRYKIGPYAAKHWDSAPHYLTTWRPDIYIVAYAKVQNKWVKANRSKTYENRKHKYDTIINLEIVLPKGAIRDLTKVPASNIQVMPSWRGSLDEAKKCSMELREDPRNRELIAEIETLLQAAEKTMIRAEQINNATNVSENERNFVQMELNSLISDIEQKMDILRNRLSTTSSVYQNFDQKTTQLYNLLSTVMKAMNEMRSGVTRNML